MQYNIFYNPVQFLAFFVFVFSCTKPIILTTMSIQVVGSVGYSGTAWLQCEPLRKEKQFHGNCMLQHQTCHLMPRLLTVLYLGREQNINWREKTLNAKGHYPFFLPGRKSLLGARICAVTPACQRQCQAGTGESREVSQVDSGPTLF